MAEVRAVRPGRVFLSYRREDTAFPAAWLYERLVGRFGREEVFKDVDSIDLGDDFAEVIGNAVGSCDVLLAMIGREWTMITNPGGHRRLDDPNDFVRLEIETALQRGVRVIPILVEGARLPRAEQLPVSLAELVRRQALELNPNQFEYDTTRLLDTLEKTITQQQAGEAEEQTRRPEKRARRVAVTPRAVAALTTSPRLTKPKAAFIAAVAAVIAAAVIGLFSLFSTNSHTPSPKPGVSQESLNYLDKKPQFCPSGSGALGCSYGFRVQGPDLVRSYHGNPQARLALAGPDHANDTAGTRYILVRVWVTALSSSVNVNPSEFTIGASNAGRDFATTAPLPGLADQVRGPVQVAAGQDFIGTLAFLDQPAPARHVDWLLSSGEPAASWSVPG